MNLSSRLARPMVLRAVVAALLLSAALGASPAVSETAAPSAPAGVTRGVPVGDDDVGPTIRIEGTRRVRLPETARLRVVGSDRQRIERVTVIYDGAQIVSRAPAGRDRKRLALTVSFHRPGRYVLRAIAVDGAGVDSGYKRATVVVSPRRAAR